MGAITSFFPARHFVTQQHAELLEKLAKRLGRTMLVADQRKLVLDQRMIDDTDAFHEHLLLEADSFRIRCRY